VTVTNTFCGGLLAGTCKQGKLSGPGRRACASELAVRTAPAPCLLAVDSTRQQVTSFHGVKA
jgi:hypothetical protein